MRRELNGDVKPLTIVNHQRNLPPHDRNPNPYREEIIGNAKQTRLGLMTTWDIFRLLRNKERLGWSNEANAHFLWDGADRAGPEHVRGNRSRRADMDRQIWHNPGGRD